MRIINKKHLLIILLMGVIITGVIIFKPKENVKLDNVILKQKVNNKTFAMYTETDDGYKEYNNNKFPDMYVLNINESKCIDNNGKEVDNILSFNNGEVTITSGKTIYCYLYFDKTLGVEIKEKEPKGLSEGIKGAMYRFQGQQTDNVNNYICFGTSEKDDCTQDTDHYMYRIIGIEASTGRVKVIKKEALDESMAWADNNRENIEFPDSKIYKAISGDDFLGNSTYVPEGWEEKIATNTWMYGDMISNNTIGARQTGEGLYLTETGKKGTIWDAKANQGDPGALSAVVGYENSPYKDDTVYYIRHNNENWTEKFEGKVSLMYLHDYYLSVSNTANCQKDEEQYAKCKTGWMHLSQNDSGVTGNGVHEWTMSRFGWWAYGGFFICNYVSSAGYTTTYDVNNSLSVRPVFYLASANELAGGTGTINDPFIIK